MGGTNADYLVSARLCEKATLSYTSGSGVALHMYTCEATRKLVFAAAGTANIAFVFAFHCFYLFFFFLLCWEDAITITSNLAGRAKVATAKKCRY